MTTTTVFGRMHGTGWDDVDTVMETLAANERGDNSRQVVVTPDQEIVVVDKGAAERSPQPLTVVPQGRMA